MTTDDNPYDPYYNWDYRRVPKVGDRVMEFLATVKRLHLRDWNFTDLMAHVREQGDDYGEFRFTAPLWDGVEVDAKGRPVGPIGGSPKSPLFQQSQGWTKLSPRDIHGSTVWWRAPEEGTAVTWDVPGWASQLLNGVNVLAHVHVRVFVGGLDTRLNETVKYVEMRSDSDEHEEQQAAKAIRRAAPMLAGNVLANYRHVLSQAVRHTLSYVCGEAPEPAVEASKYDLPDAAFSARLGG